MFNLAWFVAADPMFNLASDHDCSAAVEDGGNNHRLCFCHTGAAPSATLTDSATAPPPLRKEGWYRGGYTYDSGTGDSTTQSCTSAC
jgi:hypothetical protein